MIRKCSNLPVFTLLNDAVPLKIEAGLYYDQGVNHILKSVIY